MARKLRMNLRINDIEGKVCESCGKPLTVEDVYARKIGNEIHYFCCSHCADAFERKMKQG